VAQSELDRIRKLMLENAGSQADYEKALSVREALVAEREEQLIRLNIAQLNEGAIRDGFYFDGREVLGRRKELEAALPVRDAQETEARQQLARAAAQLARLSITAPADGTVYSVLKEPGETVTPRVTVVTLDVGERSYALARLHPDEVVKIKPEMPVRVYLPTLRLKLEGRVAQIGSQPPSVESGDVAETEARSSQVPVRIQLTDAPTDLPPGIRAILVIRVNPFVRFFSL
jgi:multidrug resistance efflux pump